MATESEAEPERSENANAPTLATMVALRFVRAKVDKRERAVLQMMAQCPLTANPRFGQQAGSSKRRRPGGAATCTATPPTLAGYVELTCEMYPPSWPTSYSDTFCHIHVNAG